MSHAGHHHRAHYQLPNALAWPMVSFPVGYDSTVGLPIAAQFWGPRFSEPEIVQAAIDYQEHFPQYHNAAPPDLVADTPKVAPRVLRSVEPATPPELSHDPLVAEEALR